MVMQNVKYYVLESINKHSLRHIKWTLMVKKKIYILESCDSI